MDDAALSSKRRFIFLNMLYTIIDDAKATGNVDMRILILAILTFFSVSSFAEKPVPASDPAWVGVWSGTLGDLPIMACMQHSEYSDTAAYYYRKHMKIITLTSLSDKPNATKIPQWIEGDDRNDTAKNPQWKLSLIDTNTLSGTWSAAPDKAAKSLPVTLKRVATDYDNYNLCGSLAFNEPRITPMKITRKPAKKDGVAYTDITADVGKQFDVSLGTFALLGNSTAIKKINTELAKEISGEPSKSNYFECITGALSNNGSDGDYSAGLVPDLITRNHMVSNESYSNYCGGAHPNYYINWRNWDLRTGNAINLMDWLNATAVVRTKQGQGENAYTEITIQPALRKILKAKWLVLAEPECNDVIDDHEYWNLHLTRKGISFYPDLAHALTACETDIQLAFSELAPLLNPAGKRGIAFFRADLK